MNFDWSKKILKSRTQIYGLIVPMQEELQLILEDLELIKNILSPFPASIYRLANKHTQQHANCFVFCIQCGIGKSAVSSALSWLCANFRPSLCLHMGTAGSLSNTVRTNDWVAADSIFYHDADLTAFGHPKGFLPNNPLFLKQSWNILNIYPEFYQRFKTTLDDPERLKKGGIASGEQFVGSSDKKMLIQQSFPNALAVDMESAAFAQACQTYELPWMILRIISDNADSNNASYEFKKEIKNCAKQASCIFFSLIDMFNKSAEKEGLLSVV